MRLTCCRHVPTTTTNTAAHNRNNNAPQLTRGTQVHYTIDSSSASKAWPYSTGHINEDMIKAQLLPASADTLCLMCGPPGMVNIACLPNLEKLGYAKEQCVAF